MFPLRSFLTSTSLSIFPLFPLLCISGFFIPNIKKYSRNFLSFILKYHFFLISGNCYATGSEWKKHWQVTFITRDWINLIQHCRMENNLCLMDELWSIIAWCIIVLLKYWYLEQLSTLIAPSVQNNHLIAVQLVKTPTNYKSERQHQSWNSHGIQFE